MEPHTSEMSTFLRATALLLSLRRSTRTVASIADAIGEASLQAVAELVAQLADSDLVGTTPTGAVILTEAGCLYLHARGILQAAAPAPACGRAPAPALLGRDILPWPEPLDTFDAPAEKATSEPATGPVRNWRVDTARSASARWERTGPSEHEDVARAKFSHFRLARIRCRLVTYSPADAFVERTIDVFTPGGYDMRTEVLLARLGTDLTRADFARLALMAADQADCAHEPDCELHQLLTATAEEGK